MRDFDLEQQLIDARRRRYGEQAQTQAPQGRMVGGRFVAPHALEYLAAGLRGFGGIRGEQMAEDELRQLQTARQKAVADALRGFNENMQDRPEEVLPPDVAGPPQPAQPQNIPAAYQALMQAPDPSLRQMGMQGSMQFAQKAAEQRRAEQDKQRLMGILQNSTPQQAIAAGVPVDLVKNYYESPNIGRQKVQFIKTPSGDMVPRTEFGDVPQNISEIRNTGNVFSDLLVRDPVTGQIVPNEPLVGAKGRIAERGATRVKVENKNYSTQETEQSKAYGKTLGEIRGAVTQAGFDAPGKLARLDRMEQLLQGIDGGAAAPAMADVASFAQSLGIKLDPKLGNKQAAEALAREMAGTLRQPGTGPMTDKDFDNFLRQVPSLSKTAEGRAQIITTMRAAIERDLRASKFARDYARQNNGVIDDNFFDAMANFYATNPVVTPNMPKTNARGAQIRQPVPNDINDLVNMYTTPGAR
jgi:hypothetical protein